MHVCYRLPCAHALPYLFQRGTTASDISEPRNALVARRSLNVLAISQIVSRKAHGAFRIYFSVTRSYPHVEFGAACTKRIILVRIITELSPSFSHPRGPVRGRARSLLRSSGSGPTSWPVSHPAPFLHPPSSVLSVLPRLSSRPELREREREREREKGRGRREERKKSEGPQGEYGARRPSGGRTPACSKAEEIAAFRQGQSRSSFLPASALEHLRWL